MYFISKRKSYKRLTNKESKKDVYLDFLDWLLNVKQNSFEIKCSSDYFHPSMKPPTRRYSYYDLLLCQDLALATTRVALFADDLLLPPTHAARRAHHEHTRAHSLLVYGRTTHRIDYWISIIRQMFLSSHESD